MKGVGKIDVILSWDDDNYDCQFRRGRHQEGWSEMSRDEQIHAVGAMATMAELYGQFIKEGEK